MSRTSGDLYGLSRHAALKTRAGGEVLVLPERAIRIGGSGGEILRLCEGGRARDEIVSMLEARYPETDGLGDEVDRFLTEMLELGGIERISTDPGRKR